MNSQQELVWVKKEFADKYKSLTEDAQREAFVEYIQKCSDNVKEQYKLLLNSMKEDAAMYRGLMIEVRKEFQKWTGEHLEASYELWLNYQNDYPKLQTKVKDFLLKLQPITNELAAINAEIEKIHTWDIDRLVKTLENVAGLSGRSKEMLDFLIVNYGTGKKMIYPESDQMEEPEPEGAPPPEDNKAGREYENTKKGEIT